MHEACACIYAQHRCVCLYASASDIKRNVCAPLMAGQSIHPPVPQQSLSMSVSIVAKRWKEKKKSRTLVGLHESFPSTPPRLIPFTTTTATAHALHQLSLSPFSLFNKLSASVSRPIPDEDLYPTTISSHFPTLYITRRDSLSLSRFSIGLLSNLLFTGGCSMKRVCSFIIQQSRA